MSRFTSREKYDKWKADRAKKLSQSGPNNDEGKRSGEEEGNSSARCNECGTKMVDAGNFCPHCGLSLKDRDDESGFELQNCSFCRNIFSRIGKKLSPDLIYHRVKGLVRTTVIVLIVYSVISLFFGGKLFRTLNDNIYDVFTYAADKSERNGYESVKTVLAGTGGNIYSFFDYLARQSDELGILDRYITSIKTERAREGEQIADGLKRLKEAQEAEPGQQ